MRRLQSHLMFRSFRSAACVTVGAAALLAGESLAGTANAKPFMEYLKPTPVVSALSSASWGVAGVLPRDLSNGIESAQGAGVHPDYYYWDGQIIRAKDGKYHLFMSTFSGNTNFGTSWQSSDAYHAISQSSPLGPYLRQDFIYNNNGSHKGHNVSAVELPDGTYAVVVSEIVPFTIYKSSSLDGPWTGCQPTTQIGASNISLFPRHDGKFQIVERNGTMAISDTLCGTYVKQKPTCSYTQNATDSIYPKRTSIPGVSNPAYTWQEDPHIWRSGGVYHIIYSGSGDRVGWHVYSVDGITNWKDNGYAWSPRDYQKIFSYEGTSTCSQWYKMERPGVVLQDGHPTHITWAVSDVDKDNQVLPGTNHGTKIVVVPFDGVSFDQDFGVGGAGGAGTGGAGGTSSAGGRGGSAGSVASMGGAISAGGSNAAGGASSVSGGGGTTASSGASGAATTGGESATGGSVSHGGGPSTSAGGQAAGGIQAVGGASGSAHENAASDASGCGCRIASAPAPWKSLALLGIAGLLGRRRGRRRNRQ
ncbi:MAG TPA: MYXO-CTERM sorting domain-containing protein [Polyangiaceae bacterium]|nr:MYXO-CTERM sorting domain-containing protein [Polyangiaceae bacterium]